jgi:hypothetical protein
MSQNLKVAAGPFKAAVAEFAAAARRVAQDPARWAAPLGEGKWSPAQVTLHLVMAFEAVRRELDEGVPMALRTRRWQQFLLRHTILRRLLRGGPFPGGAKSPREARPPVPTESAESLIARFEALGAEMEARAEAEARAGTGLQLRHPYFGRLSMAEMMYIAARHIEHHRGQLPA